jgi:dihydrolipoamide dehydrogenase
MVFAITQGFLSFHFHCCAISSISKCALYNIPFSFASLPCDLCHVVFILLFVDSICPAMDKETTKKFLTTLKKQGFKFKLKTKVTSSEVTSEGVVLTMEPSKGGDATQDTFDTVLVATGRRPYTDGLGLEHLGIQTDKLGRIQVDDHFRTAVPNIYAIGDCIDGPMLAHKAEEEGIAAVEIIAGYAGHVNYDAIPGMY